MTTTSHLPEFPSAGIGTLFLAEQVVEASQGRSLRLSG